MISPPGWRRRESISAATAPRAIEDPGQAASGSDRENTTLGMSFIGAAYSSSEVRQNPAISW